MSLTYTHPLGKLPFIPRGPFCLTLLRLGEVAPDLDVHTLVNTYAMADRFMLPPHCTTSIVKVWRSLASLCIRRSDQEGDKSSIVVVAWKLRSQVRGSFAFIHRFAKRGILLV